MGENAMLSHKEIKALHKRLVEEKREMTAEERAAITEYLAADHDGDLTLQRLQEEMREITPETREAFEKKMEGMSEEALTEALMAYIKQFNENPEFLKLARALERQEERRRKQAERN